jgi:hypothetical protein
LLVCFQNFVNLYYLASFVDGKRKDVYTKIRHSKYFFEADTDPGPGPYLNQG